MFEKGEIETKSPPKKIYEMINTSDRILDYYTGSTNNTKKRNNWTDKLFVSINLSTQKRISNKIKLNKKVYKSIFCNYVLL